MEHGNTFNIIGGSIQGSETNWEFGESDKIMKYDPNGGQWIELQTLMSEAKNILTAIRVKSTFFKSC